MEEVVEVELVLPEIRFQKFTEVQGVICFAAVQPRMHPLAARASTRGSLVEIVRVQIAVAPEHVQDALLFIRSWHAVQRRLVDSLGKQLRDMATGVRHALATRHGATAEEVPKNCGRSASHCVRTNIDVA